MRIIYPCAWCLRLPGGFCRGCIFVHQVRLAFHPSFVVDAFSSASRGWLSICRGCICVHQVRLAFHLSWMHFRPSSAAGFPSIVWGGCIFVRHVAAGFSAFVCHRCIIWHFPTCAMEALFRAVRGGGLGGGYPPPAQPPLKIARQMSFPKEIPHNPINAYAFPQYHVFQYRVYQYAFPRLFSERAVPHEGRLCTLACLTTPRRGGT